jgi:hypothetical protein
MRILMLLVSCFSLAGLFASSDTTKASEVCRAATAWCQSGTTISGCDALKALACQDSLACEPPLSACKRGPIGPGTCFDAEKYVCDLGRIRERGTKDIVHSSG